MKAIISISISVFAIISLQAQQGVGTTRVNPDTLIEFGTELRGMVLGPSDAVNATNAQTAAGTICFDQATGSFRMYNGTTWSTVVSGGITGGNTPGIDSEQFFIGALNSTTGGGVTNGVLILGEDTSETKGLVLPNLSNGHRFFTDPVAGLMYYDTDSQMVMVYNGNAWTAF